jgi:hypothetical protein
MALSGDRVETRSCERIDHPRPQINLGRRTSAPRQRKRIAKRLLGDAQHSSHPRSPEYRAGNRKLSDETWRGLINARIKSDATRAIRGNTESTSAALKTAPGRLLSKLRRRLTWPKLILLSKKPRRPKAIPLSERPKRHP